MQSYISKLFMSIFVVSLVFLSLTNLYAKQESRLALLIGNSNYQYAGKLDNPINDVRAIKRVLEQLGFTVLKFEDCSQNTMKRAIDKFGRQLKTKDVGLFFYAGHGVQVDGYNYLLPVNAKLDNENDAEYDCVRAGRILAKMESAGSRTNIVILDACRVNPFERAWRRGEKGSGLAFMNAPSGSLIAYSTAPGKTALDGGGRNSPYTRALLEHMDMPDITIIQMFQRVRSTVMKQSDKKQIPWESTSLRGDFYFKGDKSTKVLNKVNEKPVISAKKKNLWESMEEASALRKQILQNTLQEQNRAVETNPRHSKAYIRRGIVYTKLNQNEKAIQDYTKAIQLDVNNINAYFLRGRCYFQLQKYTEAIQDYTKAINLNPNKIENSKRMEQLIREIDEYAKDIHDFKKYIEIVTEASLTNDLFYHNRGRCYRYLKEYTKAIQDYTKAIELSPNNEHPYSQRAICYWKLKQYTKAIQDYTKAIELNPKSKMNYWQRANRYKELKQHTKAIQDFKKSIELGAAGHLGYEGLLQYYIELKQYSNAIQLCTKEIEVNYKKLAIDLKKPNDFIDDDVHKMYTDHKNAMVYCQRGNVYFESKKYAKAIQDYTRSIELSPKNNIEAYHNRGVCYGILHRDSQACADANKACDLGNCQLLEVFIKDGHCFSR